jgi:hypothetical protein
MLEKRGIWMTMMRRVKDDSFLLSNCEEYIHQHLGWRRMQVENRLGRDRSGNPF